LARLGKQKQDKESGRQQSLDLNEGDYLQLDVILENIIAEAGRAQSIAEYVRSFFQAQAAKEGLTIDANYGRQLFALANQIQSRYALDKSLDTAAATRLWDLLWALSQSQQAQTQTNQQGGQQPQGGPQANQARKKWYSNVVQSLQKIDINNGDPATVASLQGVVNSLNGYITNLKNQKQQNTP
jgi:hypothetical protein